jgi:hypothetical protein
VTAAAELAGEQRSVIAAAVQRVDGVLVSPDLARVIVHWLGRLSDSCTRENGCAPQGLVEVQAALAEAYAGSRTREDSAISVLGAGESKREALLDTTAAARLLGIDATTVSLHCRAGRLGQKVGRDWVIQQCELDAFRRDRLGGSDG